MANLLLQIVVLIGIVLLVSSLVPISSIRRMLQDGLPRRTWGALAALIVLAAGGYLAFLWMNYTEGPNHHEDWLVGITFLAAAVFVFSVCILSQSTARALARMDELELAVRMDPLTQVHTRGHILTLLAKECSRARFQTIPVSVLLLDIDGFKGINDNHGHMAGDCVLSRLGGTVVRAVRELDLIGRYGGEEFLVVLPNTTPFDALQVAERVRVAVGDAMVEVGDELLVQVTVSIGVSTSMTFRENCADLIAAADRALYQAKKSGRNRVCCAEEDGDEELVGIRVLRAG
jgi:diguanylate cyclase (GGDEF)-like protein